jgi:hypothetical protein
MRSEKRGPRDKGTKGQRLVVDLLPGVDGGVRQ